ncbi:MAG: GPW/gp25 family protein [Roseburia sp.]|nr:GPW/gp25 family protein [Roseburia sp.]MCM1097744.1 GPW/gp25 family protein [Ruminococcus flavefaciens]
MASIVKFVGFDYLSAGLVAEIKRNVTALIETPEGTCPGDRSYGISQEFVGLPADVAKNQAALAVIEKLAVYEPRAQLREVTIEGDPKNGTITNIFLIGPDDEYEEEADEEDQEGEEE